MFSSRRRRSASLSRPTTPASAPAQTAATQAFLASRASHAGLSNAAAAAALRSFTTTPTPVGEIQTKRMLQRSSSQSSHGSNGTDLRRRGSAGSLTERTFRSPSPNRPGSRSGPLPEVTPPVPPLPEQYGDGKGHRRSSSLDPVQRVFSPTPPAGGRGVSLDRGGRAPASARPKSSGAALGRINENERMDTQTTPSRRPKTSGGPPINAKELERPDSRNSINFSYPMNARPNSPPASGPRSPVPSSPIPTAATVTTNQKPNGISAAEVSTVKQSITNAANAPVKKKKKRISEGSHLASGGVGGKPMGTAVAAVEENSRDERRPGIEAAPEQNPSSIATADAPSHDSTQISEGSPTDGRARRAAGILTKQPSVVREDWEGEQTARGSEQDGSPVSSPVNGVHGKKESYAPNTTRPLQEAKPAPQILPTLQTTLPTPEIGVDKSSPKFLDPGLRNDAAARTPSASPSRSRSARFSTHLASELSAESRHEPPPRSVSPAKSAMKHHSPSSLQRQSVDGLPAGTRLSSYTPSEASDTTSVTSAEGVGPGGKKKKSARVSFDAEPEVVGTAVSTDVAQPTGPNMGCGSVLSPIPAEDDMEEVMKPRPALPSFGSVRGKRDNIIHTPSTIQTKDKVLKTEARDLSASSDHAIGSLLASDLNNRSTSSTSSASSATTTDPNLPLPPEVTTVEGSGYMTDSDDNISEVSEAHDEKPLVSATLVPQPVAIDSTITDTDHPPTEKTTSAVTDAHAAVTEPIPEIAVLPATPGEDGVDRWLVNIPGGFPTSLEQPAVAELPADNGITQEEKDISSKVVVANGRNPEPVAPAAPKLYEAALSEEPSRYAASSFAEGLRQRAGDESDDGSTDGSSIYSDAAEDLSEVEGDGFGSINAIVESPMVPSPVHHISTPPDSPSAGRLHQGQEGDWNQAKTHWSNLAEQQRGNPGQVARADPPPTLQEAPAPKPKKKKKTPTPAGTSSSPTISQSQPNQPAPMRKSMRPQSTNLDAGISSSTARKTSGLQSSMRPSSTMSESAVPVRAAEPKGALQKKSIPATAAVPKTSMTAKQLQRTVSNNDSDSSSSFRRRRRKSASDGRVTMRRSMRVSEERPQSMLTPASRQVRSLSPPENMGAGSAPRTMRRSMRGSVDSGVPSLRNRQAGSSKKPSILSAATMRTPAPPAPSPTLAKRFKSRFSNDSDDENIKSPKRYQSRFDDSSDDEPETFRPVRGIPRKVDEEDSTDLEDSSDEDTNRKSKVQISSPKGLGAQVGSPTSGGLRRRSSGSGRDLSKFGDSVDFSSLPRKKGLFGRFRGKRVPDNSSKVGKSKAESPARRDTHLERSIAELERARATTQSPQATSPQHGKLQRRHIPARVMSDSWPPPPRITGDEIRPNSADGSPVVNGSRPEILLRQETSSTLQTDITAGGTPVSSKTGKKKRFPILRKAFGLND